MCVELSQYSPLSPKNTLVLGCVWGDRGCEWGCHIWVCNHHLPQMFHLIRLESRIGRLSPPPGIYHLTNWPAVKTLTSSKWRLTELPSKNILILGKLISVCFELTEICFYHIWYISIKQLQWVYAGVCCAETLGTKLGQTVWKRPGMQLACWHLVYNVPHFNFK